MPGVVTHHVFGLDVHRELTSVIGVSETERDAFLLGNLGPDPFFYLEATPAPKEVRDIGVIMHREKTVYLMRAMHEQFIEPADATDARKAYALGFLCHYLLDSIVHPLVYAQQHAICKRQPLGLSEAWANRVVHATIETTIDEHLLTTRLGSTAAKTPPHKFALECKAKPLLEVSRAFSRAAMQVYGIQLVENAFVTAVSINRLAQFGLDSSSSGLRRRFDYLAYAGAVSEYLKSLSFRAKSMPFTAFANNDHTPWQNPYFEGEVVSESFNELYDKALVIALEELPHFAKTTPVPSLCEELVGNINFLGRPAS